MEAVAADSREENKGGNSKIRRGMEQHHIGLPDHQHGTNGDKNIAVNKEVETVKLIAYFC